MKVVTKKLVRAGMVPAGTWGAHAVAVAPTEREIEEADGGSSLKKGYDLSVFVHGGLWS